MRAYQTSRQSYAFWICNNSFMDFGAIGNGCDATVWTLLALWMFKNKSRRYCGLKAFSGHPITRIFWNHCFVWSTFKDDGFYFTFLGSSTVHRTMNILFKSMSQQWLLHTRNIRKQFES